MHNTEGWNFGFVWDRWLWNRRKRGCSWAIPLQKCQNLAIYVDWHYFDFKLTDLKQIQNFNPQCYTYSVTVSSGVSENVYYTMLKIARDRKCAIPSGKAPGTPWIWWPNALGRGVHMSTDTIGLRRAYQYPISGDKWCSIWLQPLNLHIETYHLLSCWPDWMNSSRRYSLGHYSQL